MEVTRELMILNFQMAVEREMNRQHLTQGDVAARMGCKGPVVSRLLNAGHNMTAESMWRLGHALGLEVAVLLRPRKGG